MKTTPCNKVCFERGGAAIRFTSQEDDCTWKDNKVKADLRIVCLKVTSLLRNLDDMERGSIASKICG